MTDERVSYHESINEQYQRVKADGVTNVIDRFNAQGARCKFGEQGLCCQLCSMGPCRISGKVLYGACGIDAAGMAVRNFVHKNLLGTMAYAHHAVEAAKTLKATAEGEDFSISTLPVHMVMLGRLMLFSCNFTAFLSFFLYLRHCLHK